MKHCSHVIWSKSPETFNFLTVNSSKAAFRIIGLKSNCLNIDNSLIKIKKSNKSPRIHYSLARTLREYVQGLRLPNFLTSHL